MLMSGVGVVMPKARDSSGPIFILKKLEISKKD